MQSRGGQVRRRARFRHGCDDLPQSPPARFTRRSLLRDTVFDRHGSTYHSLWDRRPASGRTSIIGRILDVSPHIIVLRAEGGERRLAISPRTVAWRGSVVPSAALRGGEMVIVRHLPGKDTAEHIWAQIGRVTGTIIEAVGRELLVDEGPTRRGRQIVRIEPESFRRIQVRFPRLEPGYLIDVIGTRQQGYLRASTPATAQPPYRADHPPAAPLLSGRLPAPASGTAVWHEPGEEPPDLLGLAYPALDPDTDCEHTAGETAGPYVVDPHAAGPGCVRLPYLSVGSAVQVRNLCSDHATVLPVTSCGAAARLFCDRCVQCGTSPRGRIADLTMTAFVELGGNLEDGCFNATVAMTG
jgi:hypothetical protein